MIDSIKIRKKTYIVFYLVNIFTSFLALYIARFEISIVTFIQALNIVLSSLFIHLIVKIINSKLLKSIMLSYYTGVVLIGMWFGVGSIHPMFIGYSIMLFQLILITTKMKKRILVIYFYITLMLLLGLCDIYLRTVSFYPNQILNVERLLSIFSFFAGNLLIIHFNKSENDFAVEKIYKMSYVDELTASRNRHAYFEDIKFLEDEFSRYNDDYIITYIDMDGLKKINDNYGHEEGEYAIKKLAQMMTKNLRSSDRFYRMGGDEFILAIKHIGEEELIKKIEKVKDEIDKSNDKAYVISFSYGIAKRSNHMSIEKAMKSADDKMYEMKHLQIVDAI